LIMQLVGRNETYVKQKPGWMPQVLWGAVQARLKNGYYRAEVRFTRAEKKVMRKRKPITVSKWSERHRVLTSGSALPGAWKNDVTPYLVGLMDAGLRHVPGQRTGWQGPQSATLRMALIR